MYSKLTVLLSFVVLFFSNSASAQQVVNATGSTISNNDYIFEYSIGEIAIATLPGASNTITQGLLQPAIKIVPDCSIINDTIQYFPNPTPNILSVVSRYNWITGYAIFAADGKLVRHSIFISNQISLHNLPAGVYFIKLLPGCDNKFRVLKVIKQ